MIYQYAVFLRRVQSPIFVTASPCLNTAECKQQVLVVRKQAEAFGDWSASLPPLHLLLDAKATKQALDMKFHQPFYLQTTILPSYTKKDMQNYPGLRWPQLPAARWRPPDFPVPPLPIPPERRVFPFQRAVPTYIRPPANHQPTMAEPPVHARMF
ncbi:hypothetical protein Bbelb_227300 [Branchiostoma belcheri]|nr:hypothetical protein Bbelb_227300 [Branchiostoma belcheri]